MNSLVSPSNEQLTSREKEILLCIAQGLSSKQIADRLGISPNTVSNHRKNMLLKTGANNFTELLYKILVIYMQ